MEGLTTSDNFDQNPSAFARAARGHQKCLKLYTVRIFPRMKNLNHGDLTTSDSQTMPEKTFIYSVAKLSSRLIDDANPGRKSSSEVNEVSARGDRRVASQSSREPRAAYESTWRDLAWLSERVACVST